MINDPHYLRRHDNDDYDDHSDAKLRYARSIISRPRTSSTAGQLEMKRTLKAAKIQRDVVSSKLRVTSRTPPAYPIFLRISLTTSWMTWRTSSPVSVSEQLLGKS